MRWSLQLQLLVPMVSILIVAIGLSSAVGAYLNSSWVRRRQQDHLMRVVETLSESRYPLNDFVLNSMRGLTGADFVVLDSTGSLRTATLSLSVSEMRSLRELGGNSELADLAANRVLPIGSVNFLAARVQLQRSATDGQPWSLFVLVPEERWLTDARQAAYPPIIVGTVALIVLSVTTTAIARRILRPVMQLGRQAETIAAGDFTALPVPATNDEIRDLIVSINRMSEQLSGFADGVRRTERLRTLDQLSGGLAHQLRNSVTGARLAVELHQRQCGAAAPDESLRVALRQLTLMEAYLRRFLTMGTSEASGKRPIELNGLLADSVALVRPTCEHAGIELVFVDESAALCVQGVEDLIQQLLINLLLNAIEAAEENAPPRRVVASCEEKGEIARIRIGDSGRGPPPQIHDTLFEPFVSQKTDGTGLGLSVARQIARQHGGEIRWLREQDSTYFLVELPLIAAREDNGPPAGRR